jgi:hypothetical protein
MRKHTCDMCGKSTWPGYELCPDCELKLKEMRFDEAQENKEE